MAMNYCPRCGRQLERQMVEGRERPACPPAAGGCGFVDFGSYSAGVGGLVVVDRAGVRQVLLIQRNQEPNRGGWTIPGGYIEWDETAELAVVREVQEETGLRCQVQGLVAFRSRVDSLSNNTYAVFLLSVVGGEIGVSLPGEIAEVGLFGPDEVESLPRLSPLSRALARAALRDNLTVLRPEMTPSVYPGQPGSMIFK